MNNNLRGVPVEGFADKSREAAVEGIVLLKNENNTLPLTEGWFFNTSYVIR